LATGAGAWLAGVMGGRDAAWAFCVAGTFGPFLLWSTGLYQEGTFLLLLFAGLALALSGRPALADVVIGGVALVRYEGWPLLAMYVLWRRDPRALLAGWGVLLWGVGKRVLGWEGHHPSPANYFEDWQDLGQRFSPVGWVWDVLWLSTMTFRCGGYVFLGLGALGAWVGWRRPGVRLLAAMALVQGGAVLVWMVGLERATYRMITIPVMIGAVLAALGVVHLWERAASPRRRAALAAGLVGLAVVGVIDAADVARIDYRATRAERVALETMADCEDCTWYVVPRAGFGPRERHDGCELIAGLSSLRRGRDFWCAVWPGDAEHEHEATGVVRWDDGRYRVTFVR
ncbi:MAG: hypothetical protein ACOZNI_32540, partial [Myxococcota bacterium]